MKPDTETNAFDEIIRARVEHHEVPYDPAQWDKLSEALDKQAPAGKASGMFRHGMVAAILTGAAALITWMAWPDQPEVTGHSAEVISAPASASQESAPASATTAEEQPALTEAVIETAENHESGISSTAKPSRDTETRKTEVLPAPSQAPEVAQASKPAAPVTATLPPSEVRSADEEPASSAKTETPTAITQATPPTSADDDFLPGLSIYAPAAVCVGSSITLRSTPELAGLAEYTWMVNNTPAGKGPEIVIPVKEPGKLTISLLARQPGSSRERTLSKVVDVTNLPYAEGEFYQVMQGLHKGYPVKMVSRAESDAQVQWRFPDGTKSVERETVFNFSSIGVHHVMLTVSSGGCSASRTIPVVVEKTFPLGKNHQFSPNSDGVNDEFMPDNISTFNLPFKMEIIDSSNKVVYKTSDINKPWNGRLNNSGEQLPAGFYKWIVTFENGKDRHRITGDVKLTSR